MLTRILLKTRERLIEGGHTKGTIQNQKTLVNTIVTIETTANWAKGNWWGKASGSQDAGGNQDRPQSVPVLR